eukprot:2562793-Pyramimonas_sp.AAC.1
MWRWARAQGRPKSGSALAARRNALLTSAPNRRALRAETALQRMFDEASSSHCTHRGLLDRVR